MVTKKQLQKLPFFTVAFPLFAGMFYIGVYVGFRQAIICGLCFIFCLFLFFSAEKKRFVKHYSILIVIAFLLSIVTIVRFVWTTVPLQTLIPEKDIYSLSGTVTSSPVRTANGDYVVPLKVHSASSSFFKASATGQVTLLVPYEIIEAYYPGKLYSQTQVFSNLGEKMPFIEQGLVCHFFGNMADNTNVFFVNTVSSVEQTFWDSPLNKLRSLFRLHLKRILYSWGDAGGFLLALLSGSREYLNTEVSQGFRKAGLSHVLALSGMHLSLFGGLSAVLAKLIGGKRFALIAALFCMSGFVWFAGVSPSLLRALLCAMLITLCTACGVKPSMFEILCAAFVIQTVLIPSHTIQLSFMLSYGALFGIVLLGDILNKILPLTKSIVSPFTASLSAQVFTAPITLIFFSTLTPIGILSSIVVSPLALWFLTIGIISVPLVLFLPALLAPIGFVVQILYQLITIIVAVFAKIPAIQF